MSEAREQSYYEIALTNRQVMSIFIVLLVCLLACFVSGVWIGRQGAGVRVQTAEAQLIEGEGGAGAAPLGEMDFFSGRGRQQAAAEPRPVAQPAAEPPADPVPAPTAATAPPAAPPAAEPAPPRRPPSAPASPPAATTPAPTGAAASGAPATEFLYVQVLSSNDRQKAQSVVDQLRGDGYAAFLSSVEVEGRLVHRVRIGPYSERAEAESVANAVRRKHKLSTWITP